MNPQFLVKPGSITVSWGGVQAEVAGDRLCFAHFGCKLIGTLWGDKKLPLSPQVVADLDKQFGDRKAWRDCTDAVPRLAKSLRQAADNAQFAHLPAFYCVDPHVPDYANAAEILRVPYLQRYWHPILRETGCHRVVLTEEIVRTFLDLGIPLKLIEIDTARGRVLNRPFLPVP